MAAPKKGRRSPGAHGRPGRALAVILAALAALTGTMFISGHTTPRLGIDLAGGTEITLTAKNTPGQKNAVNPTNMNTAMDIISKRVNAIGVSEATAQVQGSDNIIVDIPKGTNTQQAVNLVGTTAQLYFRPVITEAVNTPASSATPSHSPSPSPSHASSHGASAPSGGGGKAAVSPAPKPSSTTQGRAVTSALKASTPASPSHASAAPSAAPSSASSGSVTSGLGTSVPAGLQKQFSALDCSNRTQAALAGEGAKPTDETIGCSQDGKVKYVLGPAAVSGTDVSKAQAVYDTQTGAGWIVTLDFTSTGAKKFANVTGKLATQQMPNNEFAIVLDNSVVSAPSVSSAITGGSAQITGNFTQQSSEDLANVLSYGALPLSFNTSDVTTVTPQLGGVQLQGGLIAGALGLALVVLYLVAYYRGLSFVAVLSLVVSAALTYMIMTLLGPAVGFALNLPAVSGAIVAIGITADSFIVYFERIRDELRHGRSLQPAIEHAWPRARRTILVSDFVSFLAAAVLFFFSVGKVQGFAFTLGLTTVLDVVVVYLFTKPLMTMLARRRFYASGHRWSGLDPKSLGVQAPLRRGRRPARPEAQEA